MDQGIIYLLTAPRPAERLLVSLASLREHYGGPVTILVSRDASEPVCLLMGEAFKASVLRFEDAGTYRHASYVTKTMLPEVSPYSETIYLDADTLVMSDPSPLFGSPLVVTSFSDWQTKGRIIGSRVRQWREIPGPNGRKLPLPKFMADVQLERSWPAINTGVMAWRRGWKHQGLWRALAEAGRRCSFTDELAMQILLSVMPQSEYRLEDCRWNYSPIYPRKGIDPRIYHFHGSKHLRRDAGERIWWPRFQEVYRQNLADVQKWAGTLSGKDKELAARLKDLRGG